MVGRIACLVIGYAFGSFLTAECVVRHVRGVSAFDVGLGNPGMANVMAVLGLRWGLVTLAGDIFKTLAAVVVCRLLFAPLGDAATLWAGLGVTIGHNYPFWHRFQGGKGVATTCSAIVLASPVAGFVSLLVGAAVVVGSKYLCVGALAIPAAFLAFSLVSGSVDAIVVSVALCVLMAIAHVPAVLGIRTGETGKTDVLAKIRQGRIQG